MAFAIKNLTLAETHLRFPIVMLLGAVFALFLLIFISSKLVQLFRPNTDTPTRYAFRFAAFGVAFLVAVFVLVTVLVPQRTEPNSGYPAHNRASNFDEVTGISDQSAADYTSATLVPQTDTDVTVASRDDTFWLPISREMLNKLAGDPVDVYVNGRLIARGEVLVLNDNFCIRISEILADVQEAGVIEEAIGSSAEPGVAPETTAP